MPIEIKNLNKHYNKIMQVKKTGKLFSFCCSSPAIIKEQELSVKRELNQIGLQIGLLYQITDDKIPRRTELKDVGFFLSFKIRG